MKATAHRNYSATPAAPARSQASRWRCVAILVMLAFCAATADAVTRRLTSVDDLDLVYTDLPDRMDWQFEDDLLVVQAPVRSVEIRALHGVNLRAGTVSFRIRVPEVGDPPGVEAGVVFRLGEHGVPDGPAGHYVTLWPGPSSLAWTAVVQWDRNLVDANGGCHEVMGGGGKNRAIPGWDGQRDDDWIGVRIEILPDGTHRVLLEFRGAETVWLGIDEMRATRIGELGEPLVPASDLISQGDPLFGAGLVGIYVRGTRTPSEVHFADFEVDNALPVSTVGKTTTTWAELKQAR